MAEGRLWVGLDLGETQIDICVTDDAGTEIMAQRCPTKVADVEAALAPYAKERIGLIAVESCSQTRLVRQLRERAYPVGIFEARKASKFLAIRRSKTDRGDAKGLADLGRLGQNTVSQVYLKSPECQQLRARLMMRHRLIQMRISAEQTLRSRLAMHNQAVRFSWMPSTMRQRLAVAFAQIKLEDGIDLTADLEPLISVCESLRRYEKQLDLDLTRHANKSEVCRRLMEVPGVGPICALSFVSAIEDPRRFARAADVGAYLGLVPRRFQSGDNFRRMGITKTGSKLTRTHLFTAAMVFRTYAPDCALKQWSEALRARSGWKSARVALARRLAIVMLTMWKTGTHFEARQR